MKVDTAALLRSVDLVAVAGKYTQLRKNGREHTGRCPFHSDKKPSFHVVPEKGFAHCFGCGWNGDAIDLVMEGDSVDFREACERLGASDFKPDPNRAQRQTEAAPERLTLPPPKGTKPPNMTTRHWGEPRRVWEYRDGTGALMFYVARYEWGEDGKTHKATPQWTWQSVDGGDSWRWGMGHYHEPRPLYGLDRLAARPKAPALICEGEKAADAGGALLPMYVALTWPGGTNGTHKADWSPLRGRAVLIWPDQDLQRWPEDHPNAGEIKPLDEQPGYAAALEIAEAVRAIGAAEVKIINVGIDTDPRSGYDAADAQADGKTTADVLAWAKSRVQLFKAPEPQASDEPPPHEYGPDDSEPAPVDEPPRDSGPPPKEDSDEWPFRVLGHDNGTYYYHARGTQQIIPLKARDHRKDSLIALAPVNFWESNWQNKTGCDWLAAANALMRCAERVGVFHGFENRRGRGAWMDAGRAVFHAGDALLVDGARTKIMDLESDYIYEAAKRFPIALGRTVTTKQANALLAICKDFRWEQPLSAYMFAGWLVVAPVCGILKWRPHLWVVGPAGSGKSTLLEKVAEAIIKNVGVKVEGGTTEAGIRNSILKSDARPILFDEFEPKDPRSQARIRAVLDLARVASSGGTEHKGSADQTGRQFTIRSMFMFASINTGIEGFADESRVTQIALVKNEPKDDEEKQIALAHYEKLMRQITETITPDYADGLLMRTIEHLATLQANVETFTNAAASHLGNMRIGDQIGPMLAGCYLLHSTDKISFDKALEWIKARDWQHHSASEATRDHDRLLQLIMQHNVRFLGGNGGQGERSLGELLGAACWSNDDAPIPAAAAYETVLRCGLKMEGGGVAISTTHNVLKRILTGSPWAMGWRRALLAIEGAKPLKATRFGPGSVTPAVWLPRALVLGE